MCLLKAQAAHTAQHGAGSVPWPSLPCVRFTSMASVELHLALVAHMQPPATTQASRLSGFHGHGISQGPRADGCAAQSKPCFSWETYTPLRMCKSAAEPRCICNTCSLLKPRTRGDGPSVHKVTQPCKPACIIVCSRNRRQPSRSRAWAWSHPQVQSPQKSPLLLTAPRDNAG